MTMLPGFVPAFVIQDSLPSPQSSLSKEELSVRHLFLRKLFSDISHLDYVLLSHFFYSPYQLGFQGEVHFFAQEKQTEEWLLICQFSPYVKQCDLQQHSTHSRLSLEFLDGTQFVLHLASKLPFQQREDGRGENIWNHVSINRHGIKVSSLPVMFVYWFMYCCLCGQSFPESFHKFFSSLSLEKQFQILDEMETRFGLKFKTLGQALRSPHSHKSALMNGSDHSIADWVRNSWSYFFHKVYKA